MSTTSPPLAEPGPAALAPETLYGVITAIGQGPDLARVLPAVVDLLVEATACHACFLYLREDDVLRMRAASATHAESVGKVTLGIDEGLCGWVARHRTPAFIPGNALQDPRNECVPELEEERFQSMVAVPLIGRADEVIGVVVLHTEAPREFGQDVLDFLVHVAALVSGAIDSARLYEQSSRQVAGLSALAELGQRISAAVGREALYRLACEGVRELLAGARCSLYLLAAGRGHLELAASSDEAEPPEPRLMALRDAPAEGLLATTLISGDEELGALVAERAAPFAPADQGLLAAVANHLAVALQKADLIERLTEENIVGDLFEALAEGRAAAAESRALAAGYDLSRPHVVAVLEPLPSSRVGWAEVSRRVEVRLRRLVPGALCDQGLEQLRALLPLHAGDARDQLRRLDEELHRLGREDGVLAGRSVPRRGLGGDLRSLGEATTAVEAVRALLPEGGARGYEELGVYRYLARLPAGPAPDERHSRAVAALADYDARRRGQLLETLERYLGDRGGIASAARSLYVHVNTLRQRLERIEQITGLALADEDLLSLELAVKLARLRRSQ